MCDHGTTTPLYVPIPASDSHTGADRWDLKPIDSCLAPLVQAMSARDDYPWDLGVTLGAYSGQWNEMCDDDWIHVARVGRGPERYIRFTPDLSDIQRRLAAEAFGYDLDTPWHRCHPDFPGSNGCSADGCGEVRGGN